jgi:DNA polymerase III epsilon subunit-like protein
MLLHALIIDLATTGKKKIDEIVEIGAIYFECDEADGQVGNIVQTYCSQREPSVPISRGEKTAHHLTEKVLAGKRLDVQPIISLLSKANLLIAHDVSDQRPFINRMFPQFKSKIWYCTKTGIFWEEKEQYATALRWIAQDYSVVPQSKFYTLGNCEMIYEILKLENNLKELLSQDAKAKRVGNMTLSIDLGDLLENN